MFLRPIVLASAILALMASRLLPHPPNFTPIGACAIFGGATFADRRVAFLIPLAAMALSDLFLGFNAFLTPVVYACFVVEVALGLWVRPRRHAMRIALATLLGACLFFLITNAACWVACYPRTLAGLAACYVAAIPFFGNTLAGDVVYASALFGLLAVAEGRIPALRERAIPVAT